MIHSTINSNNLFYCFFLSCNEEKLFFYQGQRNFLNKFRPQRGNVIYSISDSHINISSEIWTISFTNNGFTREFLLLSLYFCHRKIFTNDRTLHLGRANNITRQMIMCFLATTYFKIRHIKKELPRFWVYSMGFRYFCFF